MSGRNGVNPLRGHTVGELIKTLVRDAETLLRLETKLARAELVEKLDLLRSDLNSRIEFGKEALDRDADAFKQEVAGKARLARQAVLFFAAAAVGGLFAFGLLTAVIVRALDEVMPLWTALLLTLGLYLLLTTALAVSGLRRVRQLSPVIPRRTFLQGRTDLRRVFAAPSADAWPPVPEQTIETLREDVEWAKHPTKSATR